MWARQVRTFMPKPARDVLVEVAFDQEAGDAALDAGDAFVGGLRVGGFLQGCGQLPELLEDADEIGDEPGVAEFQRDLAVRARGKEGSLAVDDDQALDDLLKRSDLDLLWADEPQVRQRHGRFTGRVLVEGAHPYAALGERADPLQCLAEGAGTAGGRLGLDGEKFV